MKSATNIYDNQKKVGVDKVPRKNLEHSTNNTM